MAPPEVTSNADDKSSSTTARESSGYATPLTEHTETPGDETVPSGPIRKPFAHPLSSCKPLERPAPTADQESKYVALLKLVSGWTTLPTTSVKNSPTESITDDERMWLTRECLLRYLRATSWSTAEASKRLLQTLVWRREYRLSTFTADHISEENETGKQTILGFDKNARPCLYMNPAKQNTKKSERQIQHLVFMLERVIDLMEPGQETTALLINFKNSSSSSSPSVGQGKQVLGILQNHYPERLGRALISDLPWYITTFFKIISPFIDPVTKEKMVFNQDLRNYVPPTQLDKEYGGDVEFVYDHSVYWPALCKMCDERRAAYKERWTKAGKRIGEYERYLKGGEQKSLAESAQ